MSEKLFQEIRSKARELCVARQVQNGVDTGEIFPLLEGGEGLIPVLAVRGRTIAEAWELGMLALASYGMPLRTQYDNHTVSEATGEITYLDPPSMDSSMTLVIEEPFGDPMIHRCFPGGPADLEEYRQEVVEGIKDSWIRDQSNPNDKRWEYTYHERMFSYKVPAWKAKSNTNMVMPYLKQFDQFEEVAKQLAKCFFTRRAQMVLWKVWEDNWIDDPACMQSLWFRIMKDSAGVQRLNMNVRFRSRDAYGAAFMNCFAIAHLMKRMAERVSELIKEPVTLGRYVDTSDSFHIYGSKLLDFQSRFLAQVEKRDFEHRTYNYEDLIPMFEEAKPIIAAKVEAYNRDHAAEVLK